MSINTAELMDEFNGYTVENRGEIAQQVMLKSGTAKHCRTIMNVKGEMHISEAEIDEILQPYQDVWTPKGTAYFKPHTIKAYRQKVNFPINPEKVHDEWLGHLHDERLTPEEHPISKYILETLVMPAIQRDREKKVIFHGVHQDPTPGVAGQASDSADGYGTLIKRFITEGRIAPIASGPINRNNIFDKVDEWVEGLPFEYDEEAMTIFMNNRKWRWYHLDKATNTGNHLNYDATVEENVRFTPYKLGKLASMGLDPLMWCTPKRNMVRVIYKTDVENRVNIRIREDDYKVKIFIDYYEGFGFVIPEMVFVNDEF